jgi:hypothetical protein
MHWQPARELRELGALRHVAAHALEDGGVALALVSTRGELSVARIDDLFGQARITSRVALPLAPTSHAPAIVALDVDEHRYGAQRLLSVFCRRGTGAVAPLVQASALGAQGPFVVREVRDDADHAIESARDPAFASLGSGELCGVFADHEGFLRFHCYDKASDRFRDLSRQAFYAGLGPQTAGRPQLAYHRYRLADGAPVDGKSRGALIVAFSEEQTEREPNTPHFLVSEWLDADHSAASRIHFRWRGRVIDQWTNLAGGTGVALYEDEQLSALKALMAVQAADGGDIRIDFLPFADAAYDARMAAGNDFRVMERGICARLRGDKVCGGPRTGAY